MSASPAPALQTADDSFPFHALALEAPAGDGPVLFAPVTLAGSAPVLLAWRDLQLEADAAGLGVRLRSSAPAADRFYARFAEAVSALLAASPRTAGWSAPRAAQPLCASVTMSPLAGGPRYTEVLCYDHANAISEDDAFLRPGAAPTEGASVVLQLLGVSYDSALGTAEARWHLLQCMLPAPAPQPPAARAEDDDAFAGLFLDAASDGSAGSLSSMSVDDRDSLDSLSFSDPGGGEPAAPPAPPLSLDSLSFSEPGGEPAGLPTFQSLDDLFDAVDTDFEDTSAPVFDMGGLSIADAPPALPESPQGRVRRLTQNMRAAMRGSARELLVAHCAARDPRLRYACAALQDALSASGSENDSPREDDGAAPGEDACATDAATCAYEAEDDMSDILDF